LLSGGYIGLLSVHGSGQAEDECSGKGDKGSTQHGNLGVQSRDLVGGKGTTGDADRAGKDS